MRAGGSTPATWGFPAMSNRPRVLLVRPLEQCNNITRAMTPQPRAAACWLEQVGARPAPHQRSRASSLKSHHRFRSSLPARPSINAWQLVRASALSSAHYADTYTLRPSHSAHT